MRVYCSEHAHSSIDKAVILLGLGHEAVRHIPADDNFRMRTQALREAIAQDRASGVRPLAVVATIGTTSTTSVDPVGEIAEICEHEALWLHVDAAYAGVAAALPEHRSQFAGWERGDSIVVNPHKWLFTPFDLSAFYCRRMNLVRQTFSLTPDFLQTPEGARGVRNLMDTGIQLGRRFRALKLWMVLRDLGAEGVRAAIAEHIRLAKLFAQWVDADADFERVAPVPFSVVCFRVRPRRFVGTTQDLDALNSNVLDAVNATGDVFLSHTRLNQRFVLRLAVGHFRTTEQHIRRAWELLKQHTARLASV
jgi:aromatic-L-amino-acid/L-tryptophan decarboxylase